MTKLNKQQIIDLLPHREPMLLIDELYNIKKLFSATAIVNVRKDSFFVQGHFPGQPVTRRSYCRVVWWSCSTYSAWIG